MLIGIRHTALPVQGLEGLKRALAFYTENFGFKPYLTSDKDWAMITLGGTSLSLMPVQTHAQTPLVTPGQAITSSLPSPAQRGEGPARHLGIQVQSPEEVDQLYKKLQATGYPHLQAPKLHRDSSYGFYFKDTEGNGLELIFIPYIPNPETHTSAPGIVLFAHGSADPQWRVTFEKLLAQLKNHYPSSHCELAYMESCEPSLEHAVLKLAKTGCTQVFVSPVFLSSGGHIKQDVPSIVDQVRTKLKSQFPKLDIRVGAALGESPLVQEALISATVESIFKTFA